MSFTSILGNFLLNVSASIAASKILDNTELFQNLVSYFPGYYFYKLDLQLEIESMPFIYKNLETEIITDFVDIQIKQIDLNSYNVKTLKDSCMSVNERLKTLKKKVIFLGNAGIGKTTFFRYQILEVLKNKNKKNFKSSYSNLFYENEKLLPVYVPLKAMDITSRNPIADYIYKRCKFISKKKDFEQFIKLGNSGRLFILLDGYDEIPFSEDYTNPIRNELSTLYTEDPTYLSNYSGQYKDFYSSLNNCRIWLSSRKEYFQNNPIQLFSYPITGRHLAHNSRVNMRSDSARIAIGVYGVSEENRRKLIKKIFNKYRSINTLYENYISEEVFLRYIENIDDDEIKTFSYNPLFLTIMCCIYVNKAYEQKDPSIDWVKTFDDLIFEVTDLLLFYLDEAKNKDLPDGVRIGLLDRRNEFFKEKRDFLSFFSSELYFEKSMKTAFTYDDICKSLKKFLKIECEQKIQEKIIRGLEKLDNKDPNFVFQLIYSGIFVSVGKRDGDTIYDFPHRRFREIYATKYLNIEDRYKLLTDRIHKSELNEFLFVFYQVTNKKAEILNCMLSKLINNNDNQEYYNNLINTCLIKNKEYDPTVPIENFILNAVNSDHFLQLNAPIVARMKVTDKFIKELANKWKKIVTSKDKRYYSLCTCAAYLKHFNPNLLNLLLEDALKNIDEKNPHIPAIIKSCLLADKELLLPYLDNLLSNHSAYGYLFFEIASNIALFEKSYIESEVFPKLNLTQKLVFFHFLFKHCLNMYKTYLLTKLLPNLQKLNACLAVELSLENRIKIRKLERNKKCYIICDTNYDIFLNSKKKYTNIASSPIIKELDRNLNKASTDLSDFNFSDELKLKSILDGNFSFSTDEYFKVNKIISEADINLPMSIDIIKNS